MRDARCVQRTHDGGRRWVSDVHDLEAAGAVSHIGLGCGDSNALGKVRRLDCAKQHRLGRVGQAGNAQPHAVGRKA